MTHHGVLALYKPKGVTSHDVVRDVRRAFQQKSVGHAGTLDPMARGVLVVGVGEATKVLQYLMEGSKEYTAKLKLGVETDTLDAEGQTIGEQEVPPVSFEDAQACANEFLGEHEQLPPVYSAIKVAGESAHRRVRRGESVELKPRRVTLEWVRLREAHSSTITLSLRCKKGFYVRSFARDFARRLGTCGHLEDLERTASDPFEDADCLDVSGLSPDDRGAAMRNALVSIPQACKSMRQYIVNEQGENDALNGRKVSKTLVYEMTESDQGWGEQVSLLLTSAQQPIALAVLEGDGFNVVRGFRYN